MTYSGMQGRVFGDGTALFMWYLWGGTRGVEREGPRWFGEVQVWENRGIRGQKW